MKESFRNISIIIKAIINKARKTIKIPPSSYVFRLLANYSDFNPGAGFP